MIYAVAVSVCFPASSLCAFSPHLHLYLGHLLSFLKISFFLKKKILSFVKSVLIKYTPKIVPRSTSFPMNPPIL